MISRELREKRIREYLRYRALRESDGDDRYFPVFKDKNGVNIIDTLENFGFEFSEKNSYPQYDVYKRKNRGNEETIHVYERYIEIKRNDSGSSIKLSFPQGSVEYSEEYEVIRMDVSPSSNRGTQYYMLSSL